MRRPLNAAPASDPVRWAAWYAQRWFLDGDGRDRLILPDGTSGGWAFQVEAFEALTRIAVELRGAPSTTARHPMARAKRAGIDRALRAWGLRGLSLRPGTPGEMLRPGGCAVIGEIPTPSMIEPLVAAIRQIPNVLAVAADPRVLRRFEAAGTQPVPLLTSFVREQQVLRQARLATRRLLGTIEQSPPLIELAGHDVTRGAIGALLRPAGRSLPWAMVERDAVNRLLERHRPASIVLASDQHRIGRVSVEAARNAGVRTIVVQHGLPRIDIGMAPVVADAVAAWSQEARAWFIAHGAEPDRVTVTGNLRLDDALTPDRERRRGRVDATIGTPSESPRVLLALSPDAHDRNPHLLACALDAVALDPELRLVVKLHPGYGAWGWVRRAIASHQAYERVAVQRTEPLPDLLAWADLTLLHRSTVAVESLVHGTPVAVHAEPDEPVAPELAAIDPPQVHTPAAVAALARSLTSDAARQAFLDVRAEALTATVGPLDGRAGERLARLVAEVTSGEAA